MARDSIDVSIPVAANALRYRVRHRVAYAARVAVVSVAEIQNEQTSIWRVWTGATGGTFTATFGNTSAPIAFNSTASQLESALEAIPNVVDVRVSGSGTEADPWVIEMLNPTGQWIFGSISSLTFNSSGLTGGVIQRTDARPGRRSIQEVWTNGRAGSFRLGYRIGAQVHWSASIAYNATAATVDGVLDNLGRALYGQHDVTGSGTQSAPWRITISVGNQYQVPPFESDASGLSNPAPILPGDWVETDLIDNEHTIAGLMSNTRYEIQTQAITASGPGAWSSSTFETTEAAASADLALPTPFGFHTEAANSRSFAMRGEDVDDSSGYLFRYRRLSPNPTAFAEAITDRPNFTVYGLDRIGQGGLEIAERSPASFLNISPGDVWEGTWKAQGNDISLGDSAEAKFKVTIPAVGTSLTAAEGQQADAIEKLPNPAPTLSASNSRSLTIAWTTIANASGYEVRWQQDGYLRSATDVFQLEGDATSHIIEGLAPNMDYTVTVKALGAGRFSNSDEAALIGSSTRTPLLSPTRIRATSITANSVAFRWSGVTNAASYYVQAWEAGSDVDIGPGSVGISITATLTGLSEGTEYFVAVSARAPSTGVIGDSLASFWSVTTLESGSAPSTRLAAPVVTFVGTDTHQALMRFPAIPNAVNILVGYRPMLLGPSWSDPPDYPQWNFATFLRPGDGTSVGIIELPSGTPFEFSIQAIGDGVNYTDSLITTGTMTTRFRRAAPSNALPPPVIRFPDPEQFPERAPTLLLDLNGNPIDLGYDLPTGRFAILSTPVEFVSRGTGTYYQFRYSWNTQVFQGLDREGQWTAYATHLLRDRDISPVDGKTLFTVPHYITALRQDETWPGGDLQRQSSADQRMSELLVKIQCRAIRPQGSATVVTSNWSEVLHTRMFYWSDD